MSNPKDWKAKATSAAPTGAEAQEQSFLNQDEPHKEIEATLTSR